MLLSLLLSATVTLATAQIPLGTSSSISGTKYGIFVDRILVNSTTSLVLENYRVGISPPEAFITVKTVGSDVYQTCLIRGIDVGPKPKPITKSSPGKDVIIDLPPGVTVKDVRYVGIWCVAYGVDLGSTVISEADAKTAFDSVLNGSTEDM